MSATVKVGSFEFDRAAYPQTDAAYLLGGVTRQHVARMVKEGQIDAVRLGRRVLIPATEIARILGER